MRVFFGAEKLSQLFPKYQFAIQNLAFIGVAIRRPGQALRTRKADRSFNLNDCPELKKHLECVLLLRPL